MVLCEEVADEEIKMALWSIGNDKTPSIDGYNSYFFKKAWRAIERDIVNATR